jgi:hypothetical protein
VGAVAQLSNIVAADWPAEMLAGCKTELVTARRFE